MDLPTGQIKFILYNVNEVSFIAYQSNSGLSRNILHQENNAVSDVLVMKVV
jgi:hypothetical protein